MRICEKNEFTIDKKKSRRSISETPRQQRRTNRNEWHYSRFREVLRVKRDSNKSHIRSLEGEIFEMNGPLV